MIYIKEILSSYVVPKEFNIGGIRSLFFARVSDITKVVYSGLTINRIELASGKLFSQFEGIEDINFSFIPEVSKHGTIYTSQIDFTIQKITTSNTILLDSLFNNDLAVVIGDENNKHWFLGYPEGMNLTYERFIGEGNNYSVKISGRQLNNLDEVYGAYMVDNSYVPPINTQNPVNNNNITTIEIITINNTLIKPTTHTNIVKGGLTVFLPANPVDGQYHIIKADGNAEVAPVKIKGNGYFIDGAEEAFIDTDYGVYHLQFRNGNWYVVSSSTPQQAK